MNINLEQAKAFCAVVDFGGYSQAAEKLHKSHSSVIYLVKELEEHLNVQLFDRSQYRNKLTLTGKKVYQKCQEIFNSVSELESFCRNQNTEWEESLKIVFDGILSIEPFINIYKKFNTEKISTIVQTYTDYLHDVEKTFLKLEADLMISFMQPQDRKYNSVALAPLKNYLVAHKDHPVHQTHKKWSLNELRDFHFLTVRGSGESLGMNTKEFEESSSFFLSDFSFKKSAIMKKIGFGWLPEHMIETELKNHVLKPVHWERKNIHILHPVIYFEKNKVLGKAGQLVIDILKSELT